MKKVLTIATLTLLIVGLSLSAVSADTPARGEANGVEFFQVANSSEERLALKLDRIDELVAIGRLTAAQGAEFKAAVTARMEECDETGPRREASRLAVGFGRTTEKGSMGGAGHQHRR